MRKIGTFLTLLMSLLFCLPVAAQISTDPAQKEFWGLELGHDHAQWPVPESLVADLRSLDDQVRFNALVMLGVPSEAAKNRTPDEVELRYASLGTTDEMQAIVAVMTSGNTVYGAVAARKGHEWQRIAHFSCWCKYERGDLLGNFVQIEPAPFARSELVVHASGGGTGVYAREEVRFRLFRGELRAVLSFVTRFKECPPGHPCELTLRWFYPEVWEKTQGGVLVETHASIPLKAPDMELEIPELQLRSAQAFTCREYKWNENKFLYEAFSTAQNPCNPSPSSE
jgi:hypothetical protein